MSLAAALPALGFGRELLEEALANLNARRQRSALALLGVVIGTAAVVAMLTIGHNAEREALRQFALMGVDLLVVQKADEAGAVASPLTRRMVEALPASEVSAAAPLAIGAVEVASGRRKMFTTVAAATPALFELAGLTAAQGRLLSPSDEPVLAAVVGPGVARELSGPGRPVTPGASVRAGGYVFTVVGVLEPSPQNNLIPVIFDNAVIVPMGSARRLFGTSEITAAVARMAPGRPESEVVARVDQQLQRQTGGGVLRVDSARQLVEGLKRQKAVHARLLAAIGSISLLVGGVGVMNVMLMSVMERRGEIGLRMAVGARPEDVKLMFLTEALALSLAGGLAGALLGVAAALVFALASGWTFSPALYAIPLGAGVAAAVGLAAGVYPAFRASRLDPISALRTE